MVATKKDNLLFQSNEKNKLNEHTVVIYTSVVGERILEISHDSSLQTTYLFKCKTIQSLLDPKPLFNH